VVVPYSAVECRSVIHVLPGLKWTELGRERTQVIVIVKLAFTQENPVDLNRLGRWISGHKRGAVRFPRTQTNTEVNCNLHSQLQ
jgi:hypothetical protein